MLDDTKKLDNGIKASRINLSHEIDEILKHQVVRAHAERWSHDLRFLTFDDSGGFCDEKGFIPSDKPDETSEGTRSIPASITGQCQKCELRTPVPSGHRCTSHFQGTHNNEERDKALKAYTNPCVHICELTCAHCSHIPLFPNNGTITSFKIRRIDPKAWTQCRHFVALSYCWAAEGTEFGGSPKAPYTVIEEDGRLRNMRASSATIDRAVDFARQNGFRMIWIDQECIEQDKPSEKELAVQAMDLVYLEAHTSIALLHTNLEQKHLNALLLAYEANHAHTLSTRRGRPRLDGRRGLNLVDLTEAVSLIANDKWNTRAWVLQEAFVSSGNMTLLFPRSRNVDVRSWTLVCHEMSLSEIAIRLDVIVSCIRSCFSSVSAVLNRQIAALDNPKTTTHVPHASSSELKHTLERIVLFHPQEPRRVASMTIRLNTSRLKRTCNAAVALTYLRLRDLQCVADKLAIVANMCGYTVRLNTAKMEETQESLGLCMIALSLANGDFSLITPEVYRFPAGKGLARISPGNEESEKADFSWSTDVCSQLKYIYTESWNPHGNYASLGVGSTMSLSSSGLSLVGMIWNMDQYIDMQHLRNKYGSSWASMNRNLAKTPHETVRLGTTHLLFEIIQDLILQDEIQVADAILNSTSNPRWQAHSPERGIETVLQLPPGLSIENRGGMFTLDRSDDNRFHQCWIIDRVMSKGGFWVGHIANTPQQADAASIEARAQTRGKSDHALDAGRHQSTLLTHWLLSNLLSFTQNTSDEPEAKGDTDVASVVLKQGDLLASLCTVLNTEPEGRSKALAERRAIFDVDGDTSGSCLVFQPYHMMLESIPRPELRSMSVSWRVEHVEDLEKQGVEDTTGGNGEGKKEQVYKTRGAVQGMWKYNTIIGSRVSLV
ncbi:heterokaryon incompatibility protein-domain-containing protein [Boeremia exigua]|uniref:heterokaryon incompatibility protein-domain-containing protein n=1 Tax=Boeremia exigua TaxID=749465 RepID=UPI001E8DCCBC|nr:heterokaryon incompatibility protein-domain-containing protein [Boeremia exigua]KAH6642223.1 heterokaryon incompatibility protein-domain-containing protein [Boeremia exigua]